MHVYKLAPEWGLTKVIERAGFEVAAGKDEPWYQLFEDGKQRQYAVCPNCGNPIQVIGLYKKLRNTARPYGKHVGRPVKGFSRYDAKAYESCPYVRKNQDLGKQSRKRKVEGLPLEILSLVEEQFDRIVQIIEESIGVRLSVNLARQILSAYLPLGLIVKIQGVGQHPESHQNLPPRRGGYFG